MDVNNFSQMRFQPSVHYGRAGLNARYQMNAYNAAMSRSGSVFAQPSYQSFSYTEGPSKSYVKGNVIGQLFSKMPDILQGGAKIFNTIKGWFG